MTQAVFRPYDNVVIVEIKSFYNIAGDQFAWKGDPRGVGIDSRTVVRAFQDKYELIVRVDGEEKRFDPEQVIDFTKEHESYHKVGGLTLFVVPWHGDLR